MKGMRVVVSGMGGELGTRVTNLLEAHPGVEAVMGIDLDPPRRRIPRATFHRVDPRDRRRVVPLVEGFAPTAVVHLGVYEPNARSAPATAAALTEAAAVNVLGAAARCRTLDRIVVRSGLEVYGRARGAPIRPDEHVETRPTCAFGRSLQRVEHVASAAARQAGVPAARLRLATVVGPHVPSPLGRYLRLPVVPIGAWSALPFSLLHQEDAAAACVRALETGADGALNVVGPGAVTADQAVRLGGRVPVPVIGPGWLVARMAAELFGAPLPDHVRELLVRGRCGDGARARAVLGFEPAQSTTDVVHQLYEWAEVVQLDPAHRDVA
ncbi:MAG: NAD-dependent epimerase/dehydratase family protein [Actinobacteria bacterium]|nr:NAD-dependent epimerase/dehydratase family protein [Actinomycetota bacterium]